MDGRRHYVTIDHIYNSTASRLARCICGWEGPQRSTLALVVDDALEHEDPTHWVLHRTMGRHVLDMLAEIEKSPTS